MTSQDWVDALAFERVEPIEDTWIQSAYLLAILKAFLSGKKVKLTDIYPHLEAPQGEITEEDIDAQVIAAFGIGLKPPEGEIVGERLG